MSGIIVVNDECANVAGDETRETGHRRSEDLNILEVSNFWVFLWVELSEFGSGEASTRR